MTAEPTSPGTVPPLPPWLYWTFLALAAGIPTILVSGVVPTPWDAVLAAVNAALAVLTGTSRPSPTAERVALAAKRRSERPGAYGPFAGLLAIGALCAVLGAGCLGLTPGPSDVAVAGLDGAVDPYTPTPEECADLDRCFIGMTVAGAILSGVGGAAGTALAAWPDPTRDEIIGIGVAGALSALIGGGLQLGAGLCSQRYVERCTAAP